MIKVLLATTFRLSEIDCVIDFLQEWKAEQNISLMILVESSEYDRAGEAKRLLRSMANHLVIYRSSSDDTPKDEEKKKPPSLLNIIEALRSKSTHYDYVGYVNSDIELIRHNEFYSLVEEIDNLSKQAKAIFAHRRDYSTDYSIFRIYRQGLDLFMFPAQFIREMSLAPSLHLFRIGQVGWDYMLPLSITKEDIITTHALPLYHKIHKTGSNTNWSEAILSLLPQIHPSWTHSKPVGRAVLLCCSFLQDMLMRAPLPQRIKVWLTSRFNYISSRIIFYGVIERLLLRGKC